MGSKSFYSDFRLNIDKAFLDSNTSKIYLSVAILFTLFIIKKILHVFKNTLYISQHSATITKPIISERNIEEDTRNESNYLEKDTKNSFNDSLNSFNDSLGEFNGVLSLDSDTIRDENRNTVGDYDTEKEVDLPSVGDYYSEEDSDVDLEDHSNYNFFV